MYFAILKINFEFDGGTSDDRKDLRSLVEKLRAKFKIAAAVVTGDGGDASVAVAALASSEERLSHTLDAITDFCEDSGFGRIASEQALLDHIDNLEELPEN